MRATGGTITYVGGRTIHTFTQSGTFVCEGEGDVNIDQITGEGGGGGAFEGQDGGAGQTLVNQTYFASGSITVVNDAGGATGYFGVGGQADSNPANGNGTGGSDTYFGTLGAGGGVGGSIGTWQDTEMPPDYEGNDGTVNTGAGGTHAGSYWDYARGNRGGRGGSGIVIVSYLTQVDLKSPVISLNQQSYLRR